MELRVLQYFLTLANQKNISKAAEYLHITQPTLSRQLKNLEDELGKQLFIRGNRKITLTEEGTLLRKRAEEIISLTERTKEELTNSDVEIFGNIFIGSGETLAVEHLANVAAQLKNNYPDIMFHIISGDTQDLMDRLEKGLFDFALLLGSIDQSKYSYLNLPFKDTWGALIKKDNPLAQKEYLVPEDLINQELIVSRQLLKEPIFFKWFKKDLKELNIVGTYNLAYNASLLAKAGMGIVITLDGLINTIGTDLTFIPLKDQNKVEMNLIWKKFQPLSKVSQLYLKTLNEYLKDYEIKKRQN